MATFEDSSLDGFMEQTAGITLCRGAADYREQLALAMALALAWCASGTGGRWVLVFGTRYVLYACTSRWHAQNTKMDEHDLKRFRARYMCTRSCTLYPRLVCPITRGKPSESVLSREKGHYRREVWGISFIYNTEKIAHQKRSTYIQSSHR